jgi:uncharacterized protein affecting Mg2+/Co2+ transport
LSSANPSNVTTTNKKTLYIIVAIIIIALGAVGGYLYLNQTTTSTTKVVITNFAKESGYTNGDSFIFPFNVTIVNQGSNDVSGLTVIVQVLDGGNVIGSDTTQVGTLQAGDQYSFSTEVTFSASAETNPSALTYTALLEQNGVVINQMNLG